MSAMTTRHPRRLARTLASVTGAAAVLAVGGLGATSAQAATTIPTTLAKIRYCESGNDYTATNPSSTASGAYQFLDSTWQSLSAAKGYARAKNAPASVQDAAALELYNAQGTSPWLASRSCWGSLGSVPSTASTNTGGSSTASAKTSNQSTSAKTSSSKSTSAMAYTTKAPRKAPTAKNAKTPVKRAQRPAHQHGHTAHGQADQSRTPRSQPSHTEHHDTKRSHA